VDDQLVDVNEMVVRILRHANCDAFTHLALAIAPVDDDVEPPVQREAEKIAGDVAG
jgi:hypothetical protein